MCGIFRRALDKKDKLFNSLPSAYINIITH